MISTDVLTICISQVYEASRHCLELEERAHQVGVLQLVCNRDWCRAAAGTHIIIEHS